MKILFIAPYIPNKIRVRPYQLLRALQESGNEITLLAVWSSHEEREDIETLRSWGIRVQAYWMPLWRSLANSLRSLASSVPLQAAYSLHPGLLQALETKLLEQDIDIVHVEHLRGAEFGLRAQSFLARQRKSGEASHSRSIPVVWDSVDCISYLFEQAAKKTQSRRARILTRFDLNHTRAYEGRLVHQFDQVVITSRADQIAMEQLARKSAYSAITPVHSYSQDSLRQKLHVVPNGVDLAYFAPNPVAREAAHIVFSGKMSYHANVTAAVYLVNDIMPRVWAHCPNAKVSIVGKDPTPEVRALAAPASSTRGQVVVTGTVPDLPPYLQRATVAVAPILYGAGIQNKVLEAMSCAAPVVATSQAASALEVEPGRNLLVADDATAFANAIVQLLTTPRMREELGQNGRSYVERKHSWASARMSLEQIYAKAISMKATAMEKVVL